MVVVVDLASQPHFFIRAAMSLATGRAILMEREIAVGFFGLFLW